MINCPTRKPNSYLLLGFCLALVLALTVPQQANAQVLYGSITGNVKDATGGAIPGAEVTIVNNATNYTQSTITNDVGNYTLANVPDGTYTLRVALTGFKEYVAENVIVSINSVTRENVVLQVGEITEQITVSGAATVLQTDTTDVHAQLESKEITDLPLSGYKNYQSLINLVPGATPARFQNAVTDTPARALTTNINGTNRNNNNTRIDGAMSVNIWLPHHTAYVPPSETIEVVNISTNNFDAEQGFAGGAATTVVTKSGTNDIHGSAWWNHENDNLNARDFFRVGKNPESKRNIWGGTIGGPVVKDKLFYFAGFEATQERLAKVQTGTVATAEQRAGDFSAFDTTIYDPTTGNPDGSGRTPFTNNIIPSDRFDPAATKMYDLIPLPNLPGLTQNYQKAGSQVFDRYNTDVKVDWFRSEMHRIWGKFSNMDATVSKDTFFGPGGGGAVGGGGDGEGLTDVNVWGIGHSWSFSPTFLADGNWGFTDMDQQVLTSDLGLGNFGQDVLGIPGTNATDQRSCIVEGVNRCGGQPRFSISGFSSFGQVDGWSPIFRDENSYTFTHNFSWTKGAHELRFGYDLVHHALTHWQPEIGAGPRGRFNFAREATSIPGGSVTDQNAFASYLLGIYDWTGKSLQWEVMTTREFQHAWYIRDRWQVNPQLTLTLGLRYEFFPLVKRADREMEFLDLNSSVPCNSGNGTCPEVVFSNNISVSKNLWAPRIGLAYRISDNDVIRAGYGITNNPLPFGRPLRGFFPLTIAGGFESPSSVLGRGTLSVDGIPIFEGPDLSAGRAPLDDFVDMRTMPPDKINRGYIQSWNMIYERKLPSDFVLSVGYVGTQTVRSLADFQMNWSPAGGGTEGRQQFPIWGRTTNTRYWDGWLSSNYHSLQLAVNRRFTGGLFLKGAYTFSRAINMTDDDGWAGLSWNDPALIRRNRAPAGFNIPHNLQLAAVYALPFGQGGDTVGHYIIQDWQINTIFSVNQNRQFGVGASGSDLNARSNSQTADQVGPVQKLGGIGVGDPYYARGSFAQPNRIPGVSCTDIDCYGSTGRNILRGPTWVNMDFSVFRTFALREGLGLEFRSEFFNISNTPHFNNPNGSVNSSNFMYITSTSSNAPGRVVRFGFKLKW